MDTDNLIRVNQWASVDFYGEINRKGWRSGEPETMVNTG